MRRHGTPRQEVGFEGLIVEYLHRRDRYAPSDEVVGHALAASPPSPRWVTAAMWRGLASTSGSPPLAPRSQRAERELRSALDEAEQVGDILLVARSVTYLSIALRREGRVEEARGLVDGTSRQAVASASTSTSRSAWRTAPG